MIDAKELAALVDAAYRAVRITRIAERDAGILVAVVPVPDEVDRARYAEIDAWAAIYRKLEEGY